MQALDQFLTSVHDSLEKQDLIKLSLGHYKGEEKELKQVIGKLALIKRELKLSVVYRYQTKDITKNYLVTDVVSLVSDLLGFRGFRTASLQRSEQAMSLQLNKKREWVLKTEGTAVATEVNLDHNKQKDRKINDSTKAYLHQLNLTDSSGKVYKNAQDKWKQINHYIELLSSSLGSLPSDRPIQVVDMGAGKGYLTFALYDYLNHILGRTAKVVGVEYRKDLVDFCNQVAVDSEFGGLKFEEGSIEDYQPEEAIDVLIALHACDTATDDAIYKGIKNGSSLIVVAPCCHKQVRRELEGHKVKNDLDFMTKHGIFLERHAEMLTDSIRSLILGYYGYETKVMQFISDQHTPKNVMIIASKKQINSQKQAEIRSKLSSIKQYFGIGYQHLERLCGLDTELIQQQ